MSHPFSGAFAWRNGESMTAVTTSPATPTATMYTAASASTAQPVVPSTSGHIITGTVNHVAVANAHGQLVCEWENCRAAFPDPTTLYRHLCDEHIGRFRQGNRCLECRWGQCGVTTLKRDHITSHLKVHVPFRPYECEICGGTFKRSHDLKKHVRRHARSYHLSGSVELRRQPHKPSILRKHSSPLATRSAPSSVNRSSGTVMMSGYTSPLSNTITASMAASIAASAASNTTNTNYSYAPNLATTFRASPPMTTPATVATTNSAIDHFAASIPIHTGVLSPAPTPPASSQVGPVYSSVTSSPSLLGLVDTINNKRVVYDALAAAAVTPATTDHLGLGIHSAFNHPSSPIQPSPSFQPLPPQSLPLPSSPLPPRSLSNQGWMGWSTAAFPLVPSQVASNAKEISQPDPTTTSSI